MLLHVIAFLSLSLSLHLTGVPPKQRDARTEQDPNVCVHVILFAFFAAILTN